MARKRNYVGEGVGTVKPRTIKLDLPKEGFKLEKGGCLPEIIVTYEMCGAIRKEMDNVVFVCTALTGDSHVAGSSDDNSEPDGWWEGMVGQGRGIDTNHFCVICANILGGCKGTTGPMSINPQTNKPYGSTFPEITVHDVVTVHNLLLKSLGITHLYAIIGGSFGGIQVLDWITSYPDTIDNALIIASATALSTQALAFDIIGRRAITRDPSWKSGDYYSETTKPDSGLAQARRLAHITYLSDELMTDKFGRERRPEWLAAGHEFLSRATREFRTTFQIESYLDHQAASFVRRFDANSYLHITRAMDEFDLAEQYGSLQKAFTRVKANIFIASLSGDWLFAPEQSEQMVRAFLEVGKPVTYFNLEAPAGHDAFLTHIGELMPAVRAFLNSGLPHEDTPDKLPSATEKSYHSILDLINKGERILDIGCARGRLLKLLRQKKQIHGIGIDIDYNSVREALERDCHVILDDMTRESSSDDREDFFLLPDNSFDTVILSETLQVMRRPLAVLKECLRIAPNVIVTFPNFGYITTRSQLFFGGHMPVDDHLPLEWYNTPNIHLFTLKDFIRLCRTNHITIQEIRKHSESIIGRALIKLGHSNLGAERLIIKLSRHE